MLCQLSKRNRHIHWNGQLVASRFVVSVVQMPSNWLFRINKYQAVAKSGSHSTTSVAGSKWCQWDGKLPNSRWMSQILMDPAHLRTYLLTVTKWWINIEFLQGYIFLFSFFFFFEVVLSFRGEYSAAKFSLNLCLLASHESWLVPLPILLTVF